MPRDARLFDDKAFLALTIAVSLLFAWIMWPFSGAIVWGTVIAIVFAPVQRRLTHAMHGRRTAAALVTLALFVLIVILPLTLITASLVDQAAGVVKRIQSGELSVRGYFQQIYAALPWWATYVLDRFGLTDLGAIQERLSAAFRVTAQVLAAQAIVFGQTTFDFVVSLFVMLYLLFFLLRDGDELAARIRRAAPLREAHQREIVGNFTTVIRAIVKGTIAVAILQGTLGGLAFWVLGIGGALLWGVAMAVFSLLPALGTALVWVPAAIYLLATGALWQGIALIVFGVLVIGSVDNFVRPILVGKDTRIPDYVVLLATLGGIAIFGVNGFLIGPVIAAMFIAVWDIVIDAREEPRA